MSPPLISVHKKVKKRLIVMMMSCIDNKNKTFANFKILLHGQIKLFMTSKKLYYTDKFHPIANEISLNKVFKEC